MNCVFCRIAAKMESASIIYEDDDLLAFLDIAPLATGHCLLIPKDHFPSIAVMPPELQGRMMITATRLAVAVMKTVKADGFNLLVGNGTCAGQVIRHSHINIIPRYPLDSIILPPAGGDAPSPGSAEKLIEKIQKKLNKPS